MEVEKFDYRTTPLDAAITLLEASAGTGKTYTIQRIVLRSLMQKKIPLNKILVVTFTRAATAELRSRIRDIIQEALVEIKKEDISEDWFALLGLNSDSCTEQILMQEMRLQIALMDIDRMPVYTIDSFFNQLLKDTAFESGSLFQTELQTDAALIRDEVFLDLFRETILTNTTSRSLFVFNQVIKENREVIHQLFSYCDRYNEFEFVDTLTEKSTFEELRAENSDPKGQGDNNLFHSYLQVCKELIDNKEVFVDFLRNKPPELNKKGVFEDATVEIVESLIASLDHFLEKEGHSIEEFTYLYSREICRFVKKVYLSEDKFVVGSKKIWSIADNLPISVRSVMEAALRAFDILRKIELLFSRHAISFFRERMDFYKKNRGLLFIRDLPVLLQETLASPAGEALRNKAADSYQVAIIDEFQDTSPEQAKIFTELFGLNGQQLYLVGDPKQSIYAFRGADVFAYLGVRQLPEIRKYSLDTNFRTDGKLIHSLNKLFEESGKLMLGSQTCLDYRPVESNPDYDKTNRTLPLEKSLRLMLPADGKKETEVETCVATDIIHLLESRLKFRRDDGSEEPILLSDIAVLVRNGRQAEAILAELEKRNVPAVFQGQISILKSDEALQMYQLMQCILSPKSSTLLRGLAISPLLHKPLSEWGNDSENPEWLADLSDHFSVANSQWKTHGFMSAVSYLRNEIGLDENLIKLSMGERRLTNFLHLAEILHTREWKEKLSPQGLVTWLGKQIQSPDEEDEDVISLRMEREGNAVRIITAHKSKGLEYPVTFCPYHNKDCIGGKSMSAQPPFIWHSSREDHSYQLTVTVEKDAKVSAVDEEIIGDEMRLLYVALTRAKNLCYLYVPSFVTNSAIGKTFGSLGLESIDNLRQWGNDQSHIDVLDMRNDPDITYNPLIPEDLQISPPETVLSGSVRSARIITSFTGITRGIDSAVDQEDETEESSEALAQEKTLLNNRPSGSYFLNSFKGGTHTGTLIHDILEEMFVSGDHFAVDILNKKFPENAFQDDRLNEDRARQRKDIDILIKNLMPMKLQAGDEVIQLNTIRPEDCLPEVEFDFPFTGLMNRELLDDLRKYASPRITSRFFKKLENVPCHSGFLNGFMDLVFRHNGKYYLLDWKTNTLEDGYHQKALDHAMEHSSYYLQYHFYLIALHLHLETFLKDRYDYEKDFGGVFYLFLRGINQETQEGVYFDRPSLQMVEAMKRHWIRYKEDQEL